MASDKPKPSHPVQGHIASLENAYRVATSTAEANNQDMQVWATGRSEQPFIAEPANDCRKGVIARIIAR